MVLKEVIFNSLLLLVAVVVLKKRFLTVFTLGGCAGLERRDVLTVSSLGQV